MTKAKSKGKGKTKGKTKSEAMVPVEIERVDRKIEARRGMQWVDDAGEPLVGQPLNYHSDAAARRWLRRSRFFGTYHLQAKDGSAVCKYTAERWMRD